MSTKSIEILESVTKKLIKEEFQEYFLELKEKSRETGETSYFMVSIEIKDYEKQLNFRERLREEVFKSWFPKDSDICVNGHFGYNTQFTKDDNIKRLMLRDSGSLLFSCELIIDIEGNYIPSKTNSIPVLDQNCQQCGKSFRVKYNVEKEIFECDNINNNHEYCEYPQNEIFKTTFKIPSKKLVIANDLRPIISPDRDFFKQKEMEYLEKLGKPKQYAGISINNSLGLKQNFDFFQQFGMIYSFVGNTSPHYFMKNDKSMLTFKDSIYFDSENGDEFYNIDEDEKCFGYVGTDLWAVNLMDLDTFKNYCIQYNYDLTAKMEQLRIDIIDVDSELCEIHAYNTVNETDNGGRIYLRIYFK